MPAPRHWFEDLADHLGPAYLRYSFTKGTEQEVGFLVEALDLRPGQRVLDVGCGPGRHSAALRERGIEVVGIDISARFTQLAAGAGLTVARADARALPLADGWADAALSLCQGGFGLSGPPAAGLPAEAVDLADGAVLAEIARVLRPGGQAAVSAFSAYFQVRHLAPDDDGGHGFDAATGVNHEHTEVKDEYGTSAPAELWTTCWTPRELRLLARSAGLQPQHVWAVTPGSYARNPPDIEHEEHLLVVQKPSRREATAAGGPDTPRC
jgi:SAM-dependent methyltransferase